MDVDVDEGKGKALAWYGFVFLEKNVMGLCVCRI